MVNELSANGDSVSTSNGAPKVAVKRKQTSSDQKTTKAARFNTTVANNAGAVRKVALVPTSNGFDGLNDNDDGDEIIMNVSPGPKKIRIPPITVFNMSRQQIADWLKTQEITNYSIKNLRHATHLYCATAEDFKKVRAKMIEEKLNSYSHDLKDEKIFRVALKGLHRMETKDLCDELKSLNLDPVDIRTINPKNPRYSNDVVYIVSFKPGTLKFRDLLSRRVVCHTIVQWDPYRRKEGIIQCSRCQRPGHGARNCNMPARCCFCGGDYESLKCQSTQKRLQSAMDTGDTQDSNSMEVNVPAKCCNCNIEGHFASDPRCPKKIAYANSRRARGTGRGTDEARAKTGIPTMRISPNGPTFAEVLKQGSGSSGHSSKNVSSSGSHFHSGSAGPFGTLRSQSGPSGPSGNEEPFSMEEISAMTFDIISSLRDVRHLPRYDAFMAIMNISFKYLYRDV